MDDYRSETMRQNRITISNMEVMVSVVDNNFILVNASLDLGYGLAVTNISRTMNRFINLRGVELFTYAPQKERSRGINRNSISGLTKAGERFYSNAKSIINICDGI